MDVMIQLYIDFPSYIADMSVKRLPIIGKVGAAAGTFFVQRGGDKEQRAQVLKNLIER
jgi:1-acyl-sn-glycerol-3-phosphate acyltransferase